MPNPYYPLGQENIDDLKYEKVICGRCGEEDSSEVMWADGRFGTGYICEDCHDDQN